MPESSGNTNSHIAMSSASTIVVGVLIVTLAVSLIAAFVVASDIFLILFLSMLFGVFLSHTSASLETGAPFSYGQSLAVVTTLFVITVFGGFLAFGLQVDRQVENTRKHLDEAHQELQKMCTRYPSFGNVMASTPFLNSLIDQKSNSDSSDEKRSSSREDSETGEGKRSDEAVQAEQAAVRNAAGKIAGAFAKLFQTTFGLLVNSMLIFFVGLFLAINPQMYRDGVVVLFPVSRRYRVRDIMDNMGETLWRWLLGRFGSMLITGVGAGLLLFFLGVPMAITLGIVTALLTFIPNIGGLVSLLLAMLFALPQGVATVGIVLGGYLLLQLIESYVVTPLIQKQQVSIPPALLIAFQAVMGVLFGLLGAAVASPLLAAGKVCVEEAYIKDVLESDQQ